MFYEQVKQLCDIRGDKITTVTVSLGFSKGSLSQWKKGSSPTAEVVKKFADYLDVSADYLLGRTANPSPPDAATPYVTPEEYATIEKLRALPPEKRKLAVDLLNQL